jgi:hypothetical protein
LANSFGGQCFCTAEKIFGASEDAPSSYGILGSPGGSPSQKPSEFGVQKKLVINHWLKSVAWLILVAQKHEIPCYGFQLVVDDGAKTNHATDFSP